MSHTPCQPMPLPLLYGTQRIACAGMMAPNLIEVTTFGDREPQYVLSVHGCKCSYCGRVGDVHSNCAGCGAQVTR